MSATLLLCPRTTFCAVTHDEQQVEIAQEKVFVRCKEDSEQQHKRKRNWAAWVRWPLQLRMSLMDDFPWVLKSTSDKSLEGQPLK